MKAMWAMKAMWTMKAVWAMSAGYVRFLSDRSYDGYFMCKSCKLCK